MAVPDLLEFLHDEVGEAVRAVGVYAGECHELRYHRDDLDPNALAGRHAAIVENITREGDSPETPLDELGRKRSTVQIRDRAVIINLLATDDSGVLIGLDPEMARDLLAFIHRCREQLLE